MKTMRIRTRQREELRDITAEVRDAIRESGVREGVCVLWSSHTTAGLTVNESADPAVAEDIGAWLETKAPRSGTYRHREGNADSHIKTTLVGPGVTLIVSKGEPYLGTWQGVFLCEFDGPRERSILVRVIEDRGADPS